MTSGARGSYSSGRDRRERILDAATRRFADGGYAQTSLADIARDVDVTGPGLKHHFPSKEHLLLAIAERRFVRARGTASEEPADVDGLGTLRLMLHQTAIRAQQPELIEIFVQVVGLAADPHGPAHELFAERYAVVVDDLTVRFRAAVARGLLRSDIDYEAISRSLIALSDGLQIQWVLTRGGIDMVGMMTDHLERLTPVILVSGAQVSLSVE
ncbi:TetR/AcrR family transcriptional regulator [Microbacterium sp. 2FI]|uniref:TetR/AcrR family transcriptional regulator n=1 Tax=Microbacterium sp. 2FI TaxID=2502193 RepID=UPI001484E5F2|nr:TetR/AcrR family transcriptional regulator [Microbacterium sp. 2FI]